MSLDYRNLTKVLQLIENKVYIKIFYEILQHIENDDMISEDINEWLICNINPERIVDKSDSLLSDLYYSILHYSIKEEKIAVKELMYFYECINGIRVHNFEEKMSLFAKDL